MKLVRAPRGLLAAGASLFSIVPLSVVTAGIFSSHVWWDLPIRDLALVGWLSLMVIAPLAWRIMMGRRGAYESAAVVLTLGALFLVLRSLAMKGTLQGVWTLTVMAFLVLVMTWIKTELGRPYFDPRMNWYVGLPRPIANLTAAVTAPLGSQEPVPLRVARFGVEGAFLFSNELARGTQTPPLVQTPLELELEMVFRGRKVRLIGDVVRQFFHPGTGYGFGVRFKPSHPDLQKELGDFLNAIRSEGHAT